ITWRASSSAGAENGGVDWQMGVTSVLPLMSSVIGHADRVVPLEAVAPGCWWASASTSRWLSRDNQDGKATARFSTVCRAIDSNAHGSKRVSAQHQSLWHFISQGRRPDETVLGKMREMSDQPAHKPWLALRIRSTTISILVRRKALLGCGRHVPVWQPIE